MELQRMLMGLIAHGYTQADIADAVSAAGVRCSQPTISRILHGAGTNYSLGLAIQHVYTQSSPAVAGDPAAPAAVITLPTNRHETEGEVHLVTEADLAEYTALYPAVDVPQALRSMLGWLRGNPGKRKTLRGMPKFIHAWLARQQDRGGTHGPAD